MSPGVARIEELLSIMATLRDPRRGCPWDREQSFATIAPYTIEEAYEVAEAVAEGDLEALRHELGDLLFQVAFHARMAEEAGAFDFSGVVDAVCEKMVRRHPHVFGAERVDSAAAQSEAWERHKDAERRARAHGEQIPSRMDGVGAALPATTRAAKLQRRAGRAGFDWPDARGVRAKLDEELGELDAALGPVPPGRADAAGAVAAEIGDLLFTVVNLARHLDVDAEDALRGANRRFESRFRVMERAAPGPLEALSPDALEALWQQAKRHLQDG